MNTHHQGQWCHHRQWQYQAQCQQGNKSNNGNKGNNQGYFCDRTRWIAVPEALSQNDTSQNGVPELFFFPAIDITRLGMSCYPTTLLSKKLA
jgi:hypothetical protein